MSLRIAYKKADDPVEIVMDQFLKNFKKRKMIAEKLELSCDRIEELTKHGLPKTEGQKMLNWIEDEGWTNYDSIETWRKGRRVVNTPTLIKIFKS